MKSNGSKLYGKGILIVSLLSLFNFINLKGQSVVLRPAIGKRYIYSKPNYSLPYNFDPSFYGDYKLNNPTVNIALEVLYPKHSFEVVFTSQLRGLRFYSASPKGITELYTTYDGFRQFQGFYNKFFKLNSHGNFSLNPFVGAGLGIGINRPKSVYDLERYEFRSYSLIDTTEYFDFLLTHKAIAKLSYSVAVKVGFSVMIKGTERARVSFVYNQGLNKILQSDVVYAHTNSKYWGSYTSRGSQFSVLFSVPIYLKRKK